ncbi:unnamed protein product, partial [Closterium sp. NIES-53]
SGVAIFDLDFDVIISAMYALSFSAEGDCYWCVPPDPGIAAAALGASASGTPPGTAPAEALHTFTLDSGASRCSFRDSTTLTPLPEPFPVRLANPSGGPVVASSSTVLPCPAVPSSTLSRLHLPSFSTNSFSTRRPRSSLYMLATEPPQTAASAQVSASGQVATSCSCRLLSHQTHLWHHHLGHPSLPRLRGMHSRLLVSGLPRSLPPLPPSPAPPCLPCVEGRQRAAPRSSSFPPTTAPLQTLHMDVWGQPDVSGQGRERYFLLVVDDYTQYTTVFPLRNKGEVSAVLIPWIRTVRLQLRERFGQDLPVLRLHSDRGGEFSSDLLRDFCRGEGILQSFTLPDSPQQNGIAERHIGLVMEVARTSMIHGAAPHFLWPFVVRYAAHQLNLWPRVSLPETSPTLRWTGKVGDASVFQVWGSRAFVRDTSADKLSACAIPGDVTFDESVPFYRLFPYRSAPSPPPPLFLAPGPPPVDPLPPQGPAPSGVSWVDPLPGTAPVQVAVVSGAAPGAASGGVASGGAEPRVRGLRVLGLGSLKGAEPRGAESEGAESEGAEPRGAALSGGPAAASPRLSSQQLREWLVQRPHRRSGAPGAGEPRDAGAGGAAVTTGAGVAGVGGSGARGAGAAGAGDVDPGAGGTGGTVRLRPYFVPLLQQVPPPWVNIFDGMWIFRVKRPPGSPPAFKARYVARGFSQQQGVDYFQTFSSTPKMTTLRVLLHVAAQRDYELHSLDFSTAVLQGSLHEEIWLRRPPGFTGSFLAGTQWSLRRPVYGLCHATRKWHDTLRTTLVALGFVPYTADPSLFLRTDTSLPPFYVLVYVDDLVFATADTEAPTLVKSELQKRHNCIDLGELRRYLGLQITRDRARRTITLTQAHMVHQVLQRFGFQYSSPQLTPQSTSHSLSAPPLDESIEPSGPYPELVGCLMYLMTCTRPDLAYPLSLLARYVAPARAEIYAGAMAAQELRWLTYLLTDMGEQPRSPPILYVDNKAMIALCQEHRLEHRSKPIALRYFLARELQQRGQLRLAYMAIRANTADVFTKAPPPGDHQRFATVLDFVPTLPHLLTA